MPNGSGGAVSGSNNPAPVRDRNAAQATASKGLQMGKWYSRGMPRMGLLLLAVVAGATTGAQAENCSDLTREQSRIERDMADLVESYPGTHIVIGLCGLSAAKVYEDTQNAETAGNNFAACTVLGCAIAGFDNCADVATKWFGLAMRGSALEKRMKRYC